MFPMGPSTMRLSTLQWALLVSLGVHAGALTLRVVDPQAFNRVFEDTPLEVVLVNARSSDKPARAQAIAQLRDRPTLVLQAARAGDDEPEAEVSPAPRSQMRRLR